jgi:short-subunit dehydrogenase involved in D-alanine esterification of teichoic acids
MKLENNTVLVTGGSSGIGLELSKVLFKKATKSLFAANQLKN